MKRAKNALIALAWTLALSARALAQTPQAPAVAATAQPKMSPDAHIVDQPQPPPYSERERWGVAVVRIGQDYAQGAAETNREVVVVMGSADISGHVYGDVRVFLGEARVASTAVIDGSLLVVGGSATVSSGAQLRRDMVIIGGGFDGPPDFTPGGESVVVGARSLGGRFAAVVPWFTRGLLWGRPIVLGLPWLWAIVGIFFLVYVALNVILFESVASCAATLRAKPLTAFMTGLLVLMLIGPICVLLAVSVVGIAVIPFVICALLIMAILGRVGAARWIGIGVLRQSDADVPARSLVPFLVGFAVLCVAYMIPLLGIVTWAMVGVFGLGASTLAFIAAYRKESPPPPPRVARSPVYSPPAAPPAAAPAFDESMAADVGHGGTDQQTASVPPVVAPPPDSASDLASFPRAGLRDRLAAAFLDLILVVIAAQFLNEVKRNADHAFVFFLLAYHIGFCAWKGTTVGGIICQLRVVKADGTPIRFVDALVRGLSAIFSTLVLGLGFFWILKDPERQAWHDRIAGTYVVRVPRNWPL